MINFFSLVNKIPNRLLANLEPLRNIRLAMKAVYELQHLSSKFLKQDLPQSFC
jgi:hypothetical protein